MDGYNFSTDEYAAANAANKKRLNIPDENHIIQVIKAYCECLCNHKIVINQDLVKCTFHGFEDYLHISDINVLNLILPDIEKKIKNDLHIYLSIENGYKNGFSVLESYYSLFLINILRSKYNNAISYLFHTFIISPKVARCKLFPYVFDNYFEPLYWGEYINLVKNLPIDPRAFLNPVYDPMLLEYIRNFIEYIAKLEMFIDEQCCCIAEESLENINAYNAILVILSLR